MENNEPTVEEAWQRLKNWCKQYLPELLDNLKVGATVRSVDELEAAIGQKLPIDVRESYLIHNGQNNLTDYYVTGLVFGMPIMSLSEILREWQKWRELDSMNDEIKGEFTSSAPEGAVRPDYTNPGWIPVTFDSGGNHIGIDLVPDRNGTIGQVIIFGRDENIKYVIANSWRAFLNHLVSELESGNFCIDQEDDDKILNIKNPPSQHYHDAVATIYKTYNRYPA